MDTAMLLVKALIFGMIFTGVLGFFFIRYMSRHTEGAISRLNKETEAVRAKQVELNAKIKEANEELNKRRKEADALVQKMTDEAEGKAREERDKILDKARQEAEDIINKAQMTKDEVRRELVKEMELKVVDFTGIILKEIFSDKARGALDDILINEFLTNLEAVDMSMIGEGIQTADVVTIDALSAMYRQKLSELLTRKLNRTINLNAVADPNIIAGLAIRFGSLALDGSLRSLLIKTNEQLKEKIEKGLLHM